ncbi:MAG: hypothetical protein IPJ27_05450 [Candidatus Accumulibacter sp.]|uniref:Uncharacterized protein n=1 Tax=Candidatus Accumulibacter proximus TaxID=2954385 RepID=A0A935UF46_9PROT|nr:hypothetical protein [Candidatus Accumulibacter proximus]
MADLKGFLDQHEIDVDALARIKHRLFVVGRFNRRPVLLDRPPEMYLFTNRPQSELPQQYLGLFSQKFGLRYENFIKALQPMMAERVLPGTFPVVVQYTPCEEDSKDSSVVIDMENYFFSRAIANTEQPAFDGNRNGTAPEIFGDGGKGIYRHIRTNLNLFCNFQPRTGELLDAFSALLSSCAMLHGLPAYAKGGALPGGILEKLVDFVYSSDLTADFSLDGIDFASRGWEEFLPRESSKRARESLVKVANTFRNVLVGAGDQHGDMRVAGVTVYQRAKDILDRKNKLTTEFRQAREAYTNLRQIVRSKVLLSMVLEWVFKAHYDLREVQCLADEDDQDKQVEKFILGKERHPGVKEPVKRATAQARHEFKKSLAENFERLIQAIIADDGEAVEGMESLPTEIRSLAEGLRQDKVRQKLLRGMAKASGDPQPFIESQKTILIDVLLPVLYQTPTMSLYDLRMLFRKEVQIAYLTTVTLDDKHQGIVRKVAQDFLPEFQRSIDDRTREIRNASSVQCDLLRNYIERIASRDMAKLIVDAQKRISCALTVIENTKLAPGEVRGASHIAPIFNANVGAAAKTQPGQRIVQAVRNLAADIAPREIEEWDVAKSLATKEKGERVTETVAEPGSSKAALAQSASVTVAAAVHSPADEHSRPHLEGSNSSSSETALPAVDPQSTETPSDELRTQVESMVKDFVTSSKSRPEIGDLVAAVSKKVQESPTIIDQAKEAIRVFHQILQVIYQCYRDNQDKKALVGLIERMTLANLMLSNQEALNLGKECSNLYPMLLDVIQNMDAENPDPRLFIRDFSLTNYFDNDVLGTPEGEDTSGITELRQLLRRQTIESLENTVSFISELHGIKHLMDSVGKDSRAEVIVVNATADEFLTWIDRDNLVGGHGNRQCLQSAFIRNGQQATACPGLVYMSDSAFSAQSLMESKMAWLSKLAATRLSDGGLRLIVPPICLSTGVQDSSDTWESNGLSLARIAEPSGPPDEPPPAPVVIVGPSPYLNRPGDVFGTWLPAGYLFAAHFLSAPEQMVKIYPTKAKDEGRFRVVGAGIGKMRPSLDRVLWGGQGDSYAFAVDFYLYMLLTVLATAENNIRVNSEQPTAASFFPFFTGHRDSGVKREDWKTSSALDRALLGSASYFSLEQDLSKEALRGVCLLHGAEQQIRAIGWFNKALEAARLPRHKGNAK